MLPLNAHYYNNESNHMHLFVSEFFVESICLMLVVGALRGDRDTFLSIYIHCKANSLLLSCIELYSMYCNIQLASCCTVMQCNHL